MGNGKSFLQEKIRERKGEVNSARARRRSVDFSDRAVQSSPIRATRERDDGRPGSSGLVNGAATTGNGQKLAVGMGVKQIEEVSFFSRLFVFWCRCGGINLFFAGCKHMANMSSDIASFYSSQTEF